MTDADDQRLEDQQFAQVMATYFPYVPPVPVPVEPKADRETPEAQAARLEAEQVDAAIKRFFPVLRGR
jgi:hypothetical protein